MARIRGDADKEGDWEEDADERPKEEDEVSLTPASVDVPASNRPAPSEHACHHKGRVDLLAMHMLYLYGGG